MKPSKRSDRFEMEIIAVPFLGHHNMWGLHKSNRCSIIVLRYLGKNAGLREELQMSECPKSFITLARKICARKNYNKDLDKLLILIKKSVNNPNQPVDKGDLLSSEVLSLFDKPRL